MSRPRSSSRVVFVRPYGDHIRLRVVAALTRAGIDASAAEIVPRGTSDNAAIEQLRGMSFDLMVVPFHATRTAEGTTNGVSFLRQLIEKLGKLPAPVVMPASSMGVAAARLALTPGALGGVPEEHLPRVLLLPEGELEDRETPDRIRALVERH